MNYFFLLILLIPHFIFVQPRELKFVQAIWRHGDRAPPKLPYPNDENGESSWPRGWDQLTNLGISQMYELGEFIRERYAGNFTSEKFNASEVYVRSSSADRALSSAQAMLNGFYPLSEDLIWKKGVSWQPFPVHADAPEHRDPLLKPTSFYCPTYDKFFKSTSRNWLNAVRRNHTTFFKFLANKTGYGMDFSLDNFIKLSHINTEVSHNLGQPSWVYKIWHEYENKTTLELITEIKQGIRQQENVSILYQIRGGLLLGDLLKRAQHVVNGTHNDPSKMVLYSSHDGTLHSLTYALQANINAKIPSAACIIMELWKNDKDVYEVELFYMRDKNITRVSIPGCDKICPFEKFYDLKKMTAIFDEKKLYQTCNLQYCPGTPKIHPITLEKTSWKKINLIVG